MIKPILFNTEMVRAILDGNKTVTRRIVKHNTMEILNSECRKNNLDVTDNQIISKLCFSPYQVGDILWVRETWCKLSPLADDMCTPVGDANYYYAADGFNPTPFNSFPDENGWCGDRRCPRWRPSIHMPKEAARIFLRVTGVRVERLQEIDKHWENYRAEGIISRAEAIPNSSWYKRFIHLWDSTVKKQDLDRYGWDANPWVWVIEFERCEKPEGF